MRMVDDPQLQLAAIDFVHHRQVLLRLHEERRARVARKCGRVLVVHTVLDVGYWAHVLDRIIADDEAATFEGELALGLCDDCVHGCAAYRCCLHRFSFFPVTRSAARTSRVSIRFVSASRPKPSASSTILPFSAPISVRPRT